jgi:hypothetical protein
MEEETTLSPAVDLVTLLDQLNDLNGNDARVVFTIIRQILSVVEHPVLSDTDNGTLLDYIHVVLRVAKETTASVVSNGCLKILAALTKRKANARRLGAAHVHEYLKQLLTGKDQALRCKALRCIADLCRSDEGAAAMLQAGVAPALLACARSSPGAKGAEARLHALDAVASLMLADADAIEIAAQPASVAVLLAALDPESPAALCAAARCLSILCRRDKTSRAEVMRCG